MLANTAALLLANIHSPSSPVPLPHSPWNWSTGLTARTLSGFRLRIMRMEQWWHTEESFVKFFPTLISNDKKVTTHTVGKEFVLASKFDVNLKIFQ